MSALGDKLQARRWWGSCCGQDSFPRSLHPLRRGPFPRVGKEGHSQIPARPSLGAIPCCLTSSQKEQPQEDRAKVFITGRFSQLLGRVLAGGCDGEHLCGRPPQPPAYSFPALGSTPLPAHCLRPRDPFPLQATQDAHKGGFSLWPDPISDGPVSKVRTVLMPNRIPAAPPVKCRTGQPASRATEGRGGASR